MSIGKISSVKYNIIRSTPKATSSSEAIDELDISSSNSKLDRDFSNDLLYSQNKKNKKDEDKKNPDEDSNSVKEDSKPNTKTDFYA